jgi:hypothetical protein
MNFLEVSSQLLHVWFFVSLFFSFRCRRSWIATVDWYKARQYVVFLLLFCDERWFFVGWFVFFFFSSSKMSLDFFFSESGIGERDGNDRIWDRLEWVEEKKALFGYTILSDAFNANFLFRNWRNPCVCNLLSFLFTEFLLILNERKGDTEKRRIDSWKCGFTIRYFLIFLFKKKSSKRIDWTESHTRPLS